MSNSLKRLKSTGFTIVELLIVIVVIGILVAVSVVAYNGVQKNALDKAVLSDVDGVSGEVARYGTKNQGVYSASVAWYSPSGANSNISFVPSSGTVIDVVTNGSDYCIRGYNLTSATYNTLATAATSGSLSTKCTTLSPSAVAITASPSQYGYVSTLLVSSPWQVLNGVVKDSSNNLFIAFNAYSLIKKVTSSAVLTTLVGNAGYGFVDGVSSVAKIWAPNGMAIDSSNNIYFADGANNSVRKVTPAGTVSTIAGSGSKGNADGTGAAATFSNPHAVVVDPSGNLYVTDEGVGGGGVIRKITPLGVVTTFAGSAATAGYSNGTGTSALFGRNIEGVVMDSSNNLYVADTFNFCIRKLTPAAVVSTLAGSCGNYGSTNGTGTSAVMGYVKGMTFDANGDLFVIDNDAIRRVTPGGVVTTLAGDDGTVPGDGGNTSGYVDGYGTTARFNNARGIVAVSPKILYVTESNIRRIDY